MKFIRHGGADKNDTSLQDYFREMAKWGEFEQDLEDNPNQPLEQALEKLYLLAPDLRPKNEEIQPEGKDGGVKARL